LVQNRLAQLRCAAFEDDPATGQADHPIGELASQLHLVQADDRSNAVFAANAVKVRQHFLARRRIETCHRLVGENNLRPLRHRPGDADTLLLPPGKFVHPIKRALKQANAFERLQRNSLIQPRQRKYRSQRTVRADAAEQNVL
jgi:hypothetical protein